MLITLVQERDGEVVATPLEPEWKQLEEWQGVPFRGISFSALLDAGTGQAVLNLFAPGAEAPEHSADQFAFIQIVRGRGKMGLPDGTEVSFDGPHLFLFQPGTRHTWHDVEEETLLSICLVSGSAAS
jgi:quercetin dioxygenase-like cupin family protein